MPPRATPDKFWRRLKETINGCLEFQGCRQFGYGIVGYHRTMWKAHRLAYTLAIGPIPPGMCVCHACDNPPCCNPKHLFIGTKKDNTQDAINKHRFKGTECLRRSHPSHRGVKNGRAKLTETQVREIRQLYQSGQWTQQAIADKFLMNQTTISDIVNCHYWPHVT